MTDPRDPERDLDRAIAHIVAVAGVDAPDPPDASGFSGDTARPSSAPSRSRRVAMAAALILVVGVGTSALVLLQRDDGDGDEVRSVDSAATPTDPVGETTAATAPPTSSALETTPSPSTSTPSTTAGAPETARSPIVRPVTDPAVCVPVVARERAADGLTLFARASSNPVPIQVIADPDARLVGPFTVVQRYFGDDRTPAGDEPVQVGGTTFWISLNEYGNGAVEWDVGDGSMGSVRSRGLDRHALLAVVGAISPRPPTDPMPGFDVGALEGLELLHEQFNTDVTGEVGSSQCDVTSTGHRYRISAINGDPVFQYGGVIDRLVPLEVGMRGPTLIVIDGPDDPAAPDVGDVVEADPDTWNELRSRPEWPDGGEQRTEGISAGSDVVVALDSVDGTTERSYLTLRLRREDGVAFLEVDTADAVLAPDAAFWRTDADPGNGGMSTARVGSVLGFRLGDAPIGEPIEVTVSVIDGGQFVLQSTGTITLIPT